MGIFGSKNKTPAVPAPAPAPDPLPPPAERSDAATQDAADRQRQSYFNRRSRNRSRQFLGLTDETSATGTVNVLGGSSPSV